MMPIVYVFLGGGLGSVCRYGVSMLWNGGDLPYGTLTANVISSLILGFLIGLNFNDILNSQYRLLLMTGFCGGFSTFSTFSGEIVTLFQSDQIGLGLLYLGASILSGLLSIVVGIFLARFIV